MPEGVCPGLDEEIHAGFALDSVVWSMRGSGEVSGGVALICAAPALSCFAAGTLNGTTWPSFICSVGVEEREGDFLDTCSQEEKHHSLPSIAPPGVVGCGGEGRLSGQAGGGGGKGWKGLTALAWPIL